MKPGAFNRYGSTGFNLYRYAVALSVVLTTVSTFLACVFTPVLTKQLAGTLVGGLPVTPECQIGYIDRNWCHQLVC